MRGRADELTKAVRGSLSGRGNAAYDGVSTDSRSIRRGEVFLAVKGERFDGHAFVDDVVKKGAAGVIVDRTWSGKRGGKAFVIAVRDTRKALGDAARYWRRKQRPVVIGVTGSCGKTTTKELIHAVVATQHSVLKNHGNLNNYFGVSQTLLKLRNETHAVVEMGINNPAEMQELTAMAEPDMGIVTNIAPVHLEGLKSLKDIYAEKKLVLDSAKMAGFINADDRYLSAYRNRRIELVSFGKKGRFGWKNLHLKGTEGMVLDIVDAKKGGFHRFYFPYSGIGTVSNIAGAVAVGRYLGVTWNNMVTAVASVKLPALRMEVMQKNKASIILDAYNANPASMKNALLTFSRMRRGKKAVVLGDMRELGRWSAYYHALLAKWLLKLRFPQVYLVGKEIKETCDVLTKANARNVRYFETAEEAKGSVNRLTADMDLILVKGSRGVALEKTILGESHAV